MKKLTQEQIDADIAAHGKWLRGENDGKRADWSGCNLERLNMREANMRGANMRGANMRGADMSWANMRGANMREANMRGADMSWADGVKYAQCSWTCHGERGRQLLAVQIGGKDVYSCCCFSGSLDELREYIKRGEEKYRASRTIAADFVSARMAEITEVK